MAEESKPRVYGMADQANRDPPAAEGLRGDKASTHPDKGDPDLSHAVMLGDGNRVTVSEGSGVAYAEATGRAGLVEPKPWLDGTDDEQTPNGGWRLTPIIAGLAIAGTVALTLWRLRANEGWEQEIDFRPAPDLGL